MTGPHSAEVSFRHCQCCDDITKRSAEQIARLYADAFPRGGEKRRKVMKHRLAEGTCSIIIAERESDVLGFAIWARLSSHAGAILEYLTVGSGWRSMGIGSRLVEVLIDRLTEESRSGVMLEMEPYDPGTNDVAQRRRERFYRSLGALPLEAVTHFAMPGYDGAEPIPMTLFWIPARVPDQPPPDAVRSLLSDMLCVTYGKAPDDPLVRRNVAAVRS